jgi:hypothetical protein
MDDSPADPPPSQEAQTGPRPALDYFDATKPDAHGPVAGKPAVWAIASAFIAVGAGILLGLSQPQGPARGLAAAALALIGLLTGVIGAWAWRQPVRTHIDSSLAAISIALAALCIAAAIRIGLP